MSNLLIVIHSLGCGGAEKSLISFLNHLNKNDWNVDLLVMSPHGLLYKDIPDGINVIEDDYNVENLMTALGKRRKKIAGISDFIRQIRWNLYKNGIDKTNLKYDEYKWKYWGRYLPCRKKEYDLAISYMHGIPNYYVIDKVKAKKKILWIHNDYQKIGFNSDFEKQYFEKANHIVTISKSCVESFLNVFPKYKNKISVLENISSEGTIRKLAMDPISDQLWNSSKIKLLSVGRLNVQKGFDLAILVAKRLNDMGIEFVWYILGDGGLRSELEAKIEMNGLQNIVKMPGVMPNPYPYIDSCTIFVQPSRFEGKSIVLDEAKILCKPILVTNYDTVSSSIKNDVNGKIVDMDIDSIETGLRFMLENRDYCDSLSKELSMEKNGNECEIVKYNELMKRILNS